MKNLILAFLVVLHVSPFARAVSNDFTSSNSEKKNLTADQIRSMFVLEGEILILDKSGKRLMYKGDEGRSWRFGSNQPIVANWSFRQKTFPQIALRHEWSLNDEGHISVKIKQFESMERGKGEDAVLGKLIKEKEFVLENFESVSWIAYENDKNRVVVKLTPKLFADEEPVDVGSLPISSNRMTIYDNKGNLWATKLDNSESGGLYYGVITHMGSFFISYLPFKGATEIGEAEKGRIIINNGKLKVVIESGEWFLPRGSKAKVYGFFRMDKKTEKFTSVRSIGSDKEANFLENINK